jgi:hypothetical protein
MDPTLLFLRRGLSTVTNAREVQMYARILRTSASAAAIIALSIVATGCGSDATTAPSLHSTSGPRALVLPSAEQTPSASFKAGRGPSLSVLISATQGGTIQMGRYQLDFPPGALSEDTEISIRQSSGSSMTLELGPHGIQFAKPVLLSADVAGVEVDGNSTVVGIRWFNESTGTWQPISESPAGTSRITAELQHFSGYDFFQD